MFTTRGGAAKDPIDYAAVQAPTPQKDAPAPITAQIADGAIKKIQEAMLADVEAAKAAVKRVNETREVFLSTMEEIEKLERRADALSKAHPTSQKLYEISGRLTSILRDKRAADAIVIYKHDAETAATQAAAAYHAPITTQAFFPAARSQAEAVQLVAARVQTLKQSAEAQAARAEAVLKKINEYVIIYQKMIPAALEQLQKEQVAQHAETEQPQSKFEQDLQKIAEDAEKRSKELQRLIDEEEAKLARQDAARAKEVAELATKAKQNLEKVTQDLEIQAEVAAKKREEEMAAAKAAREATKKATSPVPAQPNRMSLGERRALIALGLAAFFLTPLSLLISIPLFSSYFNSKGKVPALTGIGFAAFFLTPLSLFFTIPYYESAFFKAHPPANAAQPKTKTSQAPFAGTSKGNGPRQQPAPARNPQSSSVSGSHTLFTSSAAAPKPINEEIATHASRARDDRWGDPKAEAHQDKQKPKPK